ncbi:MAG: DUF3800 domain-containing protein [Candidatus Sulfotelmatobacter sp.]
MQALQNNKRRDFVHLAYLDDSDTKSKVNKWQVMAGVIIEDDNFTLLEMAMGVVREILLRSGNLEHFHEFHTCELFGGHGIFQGIEERERISAIWKLLSLLKTGSLPVVYGAVDLTSLNKQIYASADPLDISFRMCLAGIEQWIKADIVKRSCAGDDMTKLTPEEIGTRVLKAGYFHSLVMVIVDDCEDKRRKNALHKSYCHLRPPRRFSGLQDLLSGPMFHFHDDMYFGDSRYSMGIQLADLCAYFIARHLDGDAAIEKFYKKIEPHIVFSEQHPASPKAAELNSARQLEDGK